MNDDRSDASSSSIDVTTAFKDVAGDFVDSARDQTERELLLGIAIAAWNVSVQGPDEADEMISDFIRNFECETFQVRKARIDTRRKILELAARKTRCYPNMKVILREVRCQDRREGLYLAVTRYEPV